MSRSLLSDERCDEIKKEVLFLYEECEIHTYPIDCFAIAQKLYDVLRPYSSLTPEEYIEALGIDLDGFSRVEVNPSTGMNQYSTCCGIVIDRIKSLESKTVLVSRRAYTSNHKSS